VGFGGRVFLHRGFTTASACSTLPASQAGSRRQRSGGNAHVRQCFTGIAGGCGHRCEPGPRNQLKTFVSTVQGDIERLFHDLRVSAARLGDREEERRTALADIVVADPAFRALVDGKLGARRGLGCARSRPQSLSSPSRAIA